MTRTTVGVTAASLVLGAAIVAQERAPQPGYPTQAHVWIENRGDAQAIPVTVAQTPSVRVTGPVTLDPSTLVQTRVARQAWDYRTVAIGAGQDPADVLKASGAEGWEAVGVLSTAPAPVVLMKRAR